LAEIRPSHEYSSEGKWTADASACFSRLTNNKPLIAQVLSSASIVRYIYVDLKVYSKIGDDVLRVRLWDTSTEKDIFINKLLVGEGYAERMEEPFQSKV